MGGIRRNATTNTANMMNGHGTGRGRGERGRITIRIEGDHGGGGPAGRAGRAIRIGGHERGFCGGRNARGQGWGG